MSDGEVSEQVIEPLIFRGRYKAYFNILATEGSAHRAAEPVVLLLESVVKQIKELADLGFFVSDLCACAFSTPGRRLCELLGMDMVQRGAEGGMPMFRIKGADVGKGYLSRFKELSSAYKNEFEGVTAGKRT